MQSDIQIRRFNLFSFLISGVYFIAMIILGCFSVMATVIILRVYHHPETKPIPKWARCLIGQRSNGNKHKPGTILTGSDTRTVSENDDFSSTIADEYEQEQSTDDWKQLALLFDRVTFVALILGNVAVFLFVIGEYVFGNSLDG